MCQRITCRDCGKPSFAGCGHHVESVLGDVPPSGRCHCRSASEDVDAGSKGGPRGSRGLLGLLTGERERRRP